MFSVTTDNISPGTLELTFCYQGQEVAAVEVIDEGDEALFIGQLVSCWTMRGNWGLVVHLCEDPKRSDYTNLRRFASDAAIRAMVRESAKHRQSINVTR